MNITNINIDNIPTLKVSYSKELLKHQKIKIQSSIEAFEALKGKRDLDTIELYEEFKVLYLDRYNNILGVRHLTRGTTTQTLIDYKLLFAIALISNSSGILLSHNHPSGNLKPSRQDIGITNRIKEIGELIEVQLLDHIIISSEGYFSFKDEGLI